MRTTDPAEYLRKRGIAFKLVSRNGEEEGVMVCPFCGGGDKREATFGMSLRTGTWSCLRKNNCGRSGTLRQLMEHFGDAEPYQHPRPALRRSYRRPDGKNMTGLSPEALAYLESRKIRPETAEAWGVRSVAGANPTIAFPYHKGGALANVKYRHRDGATGRPWKNFSQENEAEPCLWGLDAVAGETLIITEGELDAMTFWQWGLKHVVSVPMGAGNHGWIETEWDRLKRFRTIFLCFDADVAGEKGAEEVARRLGTWRCSLVRLPQKDADQCAMLGVPVAEIEAAIREARDFRPPALVNASDIAEEVCRELDHPERTAGIKCGIGRLDDLLHGFRRGELTVWTGRNGSGKSTLMFQLANRFTSGGFKVLVASLEMLPRVYLGWMLWQALREHAHDKNYRADLFRQWGSTLYLHDHQGEIGADDLMAVMEYAVRRYGVEVCILDSLTMLKVPVRDKLDACADFVRRCKNFARAENVHVHLLTHPRKGERDSQEPDKSAVRGLGEVTDIPDNVLTVHRLDEGGKADPVKVAVLKNRAHGELGWVTLDFDPAYKLFRQPPHSWPDFYDLAGRTTR